MFMISLDNASWDLTFSPSLFLHTHTLRYKNTFKDIFPLQKDNIIVLGHRKIYAHTLTHLLIWTSSIIA